MGLKAYESTSFTLRGCRVPAANLLGGEEHYARRAGFKGAHAVVQRDAARDRRDGGRHRPRGARRGARVRARARPPRRPARARPPRARARKLRAARLLCWRAAWLADHAAAEHGRGVALQGASRRPSRSRSRAPAWRSLGEVGGRGDHLIEKLFRDVKAMDIVEGTGPDPAHRDGAPPARPAARPRSRLSGGREPYLDGALRAAFDAWQERALRALLAAAHVPGAPPRRAGALVALRRAARRGRARGARSLDGAGEARRVRVLLRAAPLPDALPRAAAAATTARRRADRGRRLRHAAPRAPPSACAPRARGGAALLGVDRSGFALGEARHTYARVRAARRATRRGALPAALPPLRARGLAVRRLVRERAPDAARGALLARARSTAAGRGAGVIVAEPLATARGALVARRGRRPRALAGGRSRARSGCRVARSAAPRARGAPRPRRRASTSRELRAARVRRGAARVARPAWRLGASRARASRRHGLRRGAGAARRRPRAREGAPRERVAAAQRRAAPRRRRGPPGDAAPRASASASCSRSRATSTSSST